MSEDGRRKLIWQLVGPMLLLVGFLIWVPDVVTVIPFALLLEHVVWTGKMYKNKPCFISSSFRNEKFDCGKAYICSRRRSHRRKWRHQWLNRLVSDIAFWKVNSSGFELACHAAEEHIGVEKLLTLFCRSLGSSYCSRMFPPEVSPQPRMEKLKKNCSWAQKITKIYENDPPLPPRTDAASSKLSSSPKAYSTSAALPNTAQNAKKATHAWKGFILVAWLVFSFKWDWQKNDVQEFLYEPNPAFSPVMRHWASWINSADQVSVLISNCLQNYGVYGGPKILVIVRDMRKISCVSVCVCLSVCLCVPMTYYSSLSKKPFPCVYCLLMNRILRSWKNFKSC